MSKHYKTKSTDRCMVHRASSSNILRSICQHRLTECRKSEIEKCTREFSHGSLLRSFLAFACHFFLCISREVQWILSHSLLGMSWQEMRRGKHWSSLSTMSGVLSSSSLHFMLDFITAVRREIFVLLRRFFSSSPPIAQARSLRIPLFSPPRDCKWGLHHQQSPRFFAWILFWRERSKRVPPSVSVWKCWDSKVLSAFVSIRHNSITQSTHHYEHQWE